MTAKRAVATDWNTKPLPEQRTTFALDRVFSPNEMDRIRAGLIPDVMEDKWFIYWRDKALYLHRSWTGNCVPGIGWGTSVGQGAARSSCGGAPG